MNEPLWNGAFWNHLIYPEHSLDEVEDPSLTVSWVHENLMGGEFPDFVVCLCLDDYGQLPIAVRCSALDRVRRCIETGLSPRQRRLLGFAHGNSLYFCGNLEETEEAGRQDLIQRLEMVIGEIRSAVSLTSTVGLAFLREHSIEGWRWAAQRAVVAQRAKVRYGSGRVYVYGESFLPSSFSLSAYWNLARGLCSLVRGGDITRVRPVGKEISRLLFEETYLPLNQLRPILQSQVILMAQAAIEVGVDPVDAGPRMEHYLNSIGTTYDYARLRELIEEAAREFTFKVHERYLCLSSRLVSAAEEFINAHLNDALSLRDLSSILGVNPSYLSRCFKKEKGIGITEYVNRQRVEQAKRLLLDRKLNITEVAFRAGFGSLQHFGRVFRSLEGCSPRDYRRLKDERASQPARLSVSNPLKYRESKSVQNQ